MKLFNITFTAVLAAALILPGACKPREEAPPPPSAEPTIFQRIEEGDTTAFIYWLEESPDVNQRGDGGMTPLLASLKHGRSGYVMDLLNHGASPNLADERGTSPLHMAAQFGRTAMAIVLIDAGADVLAVNGDGLSALDIARLQNHLEVANAIDAARIARLAPAPEINEAATVEEPEPEIPPALLLSTDFRPWTSISGDKMDAAFIRNVFDTVVLQNRQGEFFRIPLNRLVPADQITIRQLSGLDPHALAKARPNRVSAARAPQDSLALKIGDNSDWTVLENCRLLRSGANDGDSFHVKHDGKEYIFRLYFVDAAETAMTYPDRVRHQAEYFDLSDADTVELGEAAKKFTLALLASGPFTVVTQWEDAKGNSRLPRHFALVSTSQGDLDELLVQEGLVRRYGMPVKNNLGQKKLNRLKQLESEAQRQDVGAWSRDDQRASR